MTNTKFLVKLNRGGTLAPEFVQRIDPTPIRMTTNRKLALVMGKFLQLEQNDGLEMLRALPDAQRRAAELSGDKILVQSPSWLNLCTPHSI